MKDILIKLNACYESIEWVKEKTWEEIYNTCHRGNWLLWLHQRTNPNDLQIRTLAKGHCANTVRHLMKDKRSVIAVDMAIAFGEGKATIEELNSAAAAADAAANAAANAAAAAYATATAAAYAAAALAAAGAAAPAAGDAYVADAAADYASYAASNAASYATSNAASYNAAAAFAAARAKSQKETADIVRKYIPIELWNTQKMINELKKRR